MGLCCSFYPKAKNKNTISRHSTTTNHEELNKNISQIKDFSSINLTSRDFESN